MKCYRVISMQGEWEDYYENCEGCYIDEQQAIGKKLELEIEEEQNRKQSKICEQCEYGCGLNEPCDNYIEDESDEDSCYEYYSHWDDITYRIDEEEIIGLDELIKKLKGEK